MIKRLSLTLAVSGLLLWGVFAALHVHAQPSGVQLVNDPDFNDSTAWVLDNATVDSGIVALFGAQSTVAQTLPPVFVGGDYQIEVTHRSNGRANVQRVGLYSADGRPVFEGDLLPAKEWQTAVFTAPLPGGTYTLRLNYQGRVQTALEVDAVRVYAPVDYAQAQYALLAAQATREAEVTDVFTLPRTYHLTHTYTDGERAAISLDLVNLLLLIALIILLILKVKQ